MKKLRLLCILSLVYAKSSCQENERSIGKIEYEEQMLFVKKIMRIHVPFPKVDSPFTLEKKNLFIFESP